MTITASGFLVNRALENLARTLHRGPSELGDLALKREGRALMRKRVERLAPIEEMQGTQAQRWLGRDKEPLTFGFLAADNPNVAEHLLWSKSPKDKTLLQKMGDMMNAYPTVSQKGTTFINKETGEEVSVGEAHKNWPQLKALYLSDLGIDRKIRSMSEELENQKLEGLIDDKTYESKKSSISALKNDPERKIRAAQKIIKLSETFNHYPEIQKNIVRLQNKITGWETQIAEAPDKAMDRALKLARIGYLNRMPKGTTTAAQALQFNKANRLLINDAMKHLKINLGLSEDFDEMTPEQQLTHTNYLNLVGMLAETKKYKGNPALLARDAESLEQEATAYAAENISRFNIPDETSEEYLPMIRSLKEDFIIQRFGGQPDPVLHDGRIIRDTKSGKQFRSVGGKWVNLAEIQRGR